MSAAADDGSKGASVVPIRPVRQDPVVWTERVRGTYDEVRAPLWRAIVAWSGSPDVADEAVAEGFAQLLRRGAEVRDPAAWVWRAAFRIAAGELKRGGRGPVSVDPDDTALRHRVATQSRLSDEALDLARALAQLSDQQRRCIALVDVAGHTAPSAAAVIGTTSATVRVQLMRGRRRLRELLSDATPAEAKEDER
jgi:RNA polymerase sigma-70 factor (ECF subfamily)